MWGEVRTTHWTHWPEVWVSSRGRHPLGLCLVLPPLLLFFLVAVAAPARGQARGAPALEAVRIGPGERVSVDGRLDEPVLGPRAGWLAASSRRSRRRARRRASGLRPTSPSTTTPSTSPSGPTSATRPRSSGGSSGATGSATSPTASLSRSGARPTGGRRSRSGVNLAGARQDVVVSDDGGTWDLTWDAVWDSAVRPFEGPDGGGYAVEVRVPFSQLRYDPANGRPWQFNVERDIPANGERSFWAPVLPDADGYVSQFGLLGGLGGLRASRRAEGRPLRGHAADAGAGRGRGPVLQREVTSPRGSASTPASGSRPGSRSRRR